MAKPARGSWEDVVGRVQKSMGSTFGVIDRKTARAYDEAKAHEQSEKTHPIGTTGEGRSQEPQRALPDTGTINKPIDRGEQWERDIDLMAGGGKLGERAGKNAENATGRDGHEVAREYHKGKADQLRFNKEPDAARWHDAAARAHKLAAEKGAPQLTRDAQDASANAHAEESRAYRRSMQQEKQLRISTAAGKEPKMPPEGFHHEESRKRGEELSRAYAESKRLSDIRQRREQQEKQKAVQEGARGGRFYVSSTGAKVYVKDNPGAETVGHMSNQRFHQGLPVSVHLAEPKKTL